MEEKQVVNGLVVAQHNVSGEPIDQISRSFEAICEGPFEATVSMGYEELFAMERFCNITLKADLTMPCKMADIPAAFQHCRKLLIDAVAPDIVEIKKRQAAIREAGK